MAVLRFGNKGPDVEELQARLNALNDKMKEGGYSLDNTVMPLDEDGIFGSQTEAAVEAVQSFALELGISSLSVDGIYGPATEYALAELEQGDFSRSGDEGSALIASAKPKAPAAPVVVAAVKPKTPITLTPMQEPSAPPVIQVAQTDFRSLLLQAAKDMRQAARTTGANDIERRYAMSATSEGPKWFADNVTALCAITTATMCSLAISRLVKPPVEAEAIFSSQGAEQYGSSLRDYAQKLMPGTYLPNVADQMAYARSAGALHPNDGSYIPKPGDMLVQMPEDHISVIISSPYKRNGLILVDYIDNKTIEMPQYDITLSANITPQTEANATRYYYIDTNALFAAAAAAGRLPTIAPSAAPAQGR